MNIVSYIHIKVLSIHDLQEEVDIIWLATTDKALKLSIHDLQEEVDFWTLIFFSLPDLSIHDLQEEVDTSRPLTRMAGTVFQFTTSKRRSTMVRSKIRDRPIFQFTTSKRRSTI